MGKGACSNAMRYCTATYVDDARTYCINCWLGQRLGREVELVCCSGPRASPLVQVVQSLHGACRLVEVTRGSPPVAVATSWR